MAVVVRIEWGEALVARGGSVKITVAGILTQDPDALPGLGRSGRGGFLKHVLPVGLSDILDVGDESAKGDLKGLSLRGPKDEAPFHPLRGDAAGGRFGGKLRYLALTVLSLGIC